MKAHHELLRNEVVRYRSDRSSTAVLIKQDVLLNIILWLSVFFLLGAIIALCFMRYKETVKVRGSLEPVGGTIKVVAPRNAVVRDIKISFDQQVSAGQVLATLEITNYDGKGNSNQELLISELAVEQDFLEAEIALQKTLQQQILLSNNLEKANWEKELGAVGAELLIIEEQVAISASTLSSLEVLLPSSGVSRAQYDQKQLSHLTLLRERNEAQRRLVHLQQQVRAVEINLSTTVLQQRINELQLMRDKSRYEYEIEKIIDGSKLISVVASQAGYVAAIAVEVGQSVSTNEPLVYLNPENSRLHAVLYVPSRAVGKMAPGQNLLLKYDALERAE